jgi:hypothetical protein
MPHRADQVFVASFALLDASDPARAAAGAEKYFRYSYKFNLHTILLFAIVQLKQVAHYSIANNQPRKESP